jgi:predicted Zn-dependent peptidase
MKKISFLIIMLSLVFANCSKKVTEPMVDKAVSATEDFRNEAPEPGPAKKIQLGNSNSFQLDNGLKVIVVENHKLPRVSYQLSLDNDPLYEGEMAGYVSIAGQLLNKGTKSKSKGEIDAAIDFIGANLNTSSGGVFGSSLKKHQSALLEIMTDVLLNPVFPEDEFEKIKKQTLSGLAQSKSDPNTIAGNLASIINYGDGHPYGEVATEESVSKITLDRCKDHYKKYFKPNNAYLVIVGDITPDEAKMNAEKYFGTWEKGDVPLKKYKTPVPHNERRVHFANKDGAQQSVIRVTYPVDMKPGSPDAIKASVMNSILGGGIFLGRLMQNLREDKAYTYGARSSLSTDRMIGNFNAGASVRNEVTDSSVVEFLYELNRMRNEPVPQSDLDLAKSSMTGGFARSLESPQTIARFALNIARYNLPADYYETYLEKLEAVNVADVQAMANKYILSDQANIIVVGAKDEVAEKLLPFDANGEIDYYNAFGKKLEDVALEMPTDLTAEQVVSKSYDALGGKDKLMSVKSMLQTYEMDMMGQMFEISFLKKAPNKGVMKTLMGGNVMAEQILNGDKAVVSQMGQKQVLTEGKDFESIKEQMALFPELDILDGTNKLELKGLENIDGVNCYKVAVENKNGEVSTYFYSAVTNLMKRSVSTGEAQGQTVTTTADFADYKDAGEGILMPFKLTVSGAMPFPLNMELKKVELNAEIDDSNFSIE